MSSSPGSRQPGVARRLCSNGQVATTVAVASLLLLVAPAISPGQSRVAAPDVTNLDAPSAVLQKADKSMVIVEQGRNRLVRVDAQGGRQVLAGSGQPGYSGDGGLAIDAKFDHPTDVVSDRQSNLFLSDTGNHAVRRIDAKTGIVTTVAGDGQAGFSGDGGPPREGRLHQPTGLAVDEIGRLYIADTGNHRIRRVDFAANKIETIAGTGANKLPRDGGLAVDEPLSGPRGLAIHGRFLWIALRDGNSVYRLRLGGAIHHIAGTGEAGFSGDEGPAIKAQFSHPEGIIVGADGKVYVADTGNNRLREIDVVAGTIRSVEANLQEPIGLAVAGPLGPVRVADRGQDRVTVAGKPLERGLLSTAYAQRSRQLDPGGVGSYRRYAPNLGLGGYAAGRAGYGSPSFYYGYSPFNEQPTPGRPWYGVPPYLSRGYVPPPYLSYFGVNNWYDPKFGTPYDFYYRYGGRWSGQQDPSTRPPPMPPVPIWPDR